MVHPKRYDVFLSHGSDSKPAVEYVARKLRSKGIEPFLDSWHLIPGRPWQKELETALEQSRTCAIFVGNEKLGPWAQLEMWVALDKFAHNPEFAVIPVLLPGIQRPKELPAFLKQLTWVDFKTGLNDEEAMNRLSCAICGLPFADSSQIYKVSPPPSGLVSIPKLPPHYLDRQQYIEPIKRALLAKDRINVGVTGVGTVGLQGMGGIGKTVIASALARDVTVRSFFTDGVLWLTVGQQPDLLSLQTGLAATVGNTNVLFASIQQGKRELERLFENLRILLVLDDIWKVEHVAALDFFGPEGRILLTTRNSEIVVGLGAAEYKLDVLSPTEALVFLADCSEQEAETLPTIATKVAAACGYLPLALAMIGAMVRLQPGAWEDALIRLRRCSLEKFRRIFPNYPYPDLLRAIEVSVNALEPEKKQRYFELSIFLEDEAVPECALVMLWHTIGLDEMDTRELITFFISRSLASRDEIGRMKLHDILRVYIRRQAINRAELHQRLVNAYAASCDGDIARGPNDGYFFQRFPYHLLKANQTHELRSLLLDFSWLSAKLKATDATALIADYEMVTSDRQLDLVKRTLQLSAHVLSSDWAQLPGQFLGRLIKNDGYDVRRLLERALRWKEQPWLRPRKGTLYRPTGALLHILEGHSDSVLALAVIDERRVASGSIDHSVKIWDVVNGKVIMTFRRHNSVVNAVAKLSQKVIVSASDDGKMYLWEIDSGEILSILEGHVGSIQSVAVIDEQRIVSASSDTTLRVWDVKCGESIRTLLGHSSCVSSVAVIDDRRIVSASTKGTLLIWDIESGKNLGALKNNGWIRGLATLNGQKFASASNDHTVRIWDANSTKEISTLKGHKHWVRAVAAINERKLASASYDHTLRVWDIEREEATTVFEGHEGPVLAVAALNERQIVSGGTDRTLRIWDIESGNFHHANKKRASVRFIAMLDDRRFISATKNYLRVWNVRNGDPIITLKGHFTSILSITVLSERSVITSTAAKVLQIWDIENGEEIRTFEGAVSAMAVLDYSRIICAHSDHTIRVLDIQSGETIKTLRGHTGWISAVAVLNEQRIISGSYDRTLRVWDLKSGKTIKILRGHVGWVTALAMIDKRRTVSGSYDSSICIWDTITGKLITTLRGHAARVQSIAVFSKDIIISASSDNSLRMWSIDTGSQIASFTLESEATAVAVSNEGSILAGDASGKIHFFDLIGGYPRK